MPLWGHFERRLDAERDRQGTLGSCGLDDARLGCGRARYNARSPARVGDELVLCGHVERRVRHLPLAASFQRHPGHTAQHVDCPLTQWSAVFVRRRGGAGSRAPAAHHATACLSACLSACPAFARLAAGRSSRYSWRRRCWQRRCRQRQRRRPRQRAARRRLQSHCRLQFHRCPLSFERCRRCHLAATPHHRPALKCELRRVRSSCRLAADTLCRLRRRAHARATARVRPRAPLHTRRLPLPFWAAVDAH